jgi:carbohydrate-selective porin OprB
VKGARNSDAFLVVIACVCVLTASYSAHGQQTPATNPPASQTDLHCPHPADPHRRPRACNDAFFDTDETLARGWDDVRHVMSRIGLTPTASYVGVLQTNATGGQHEVWSYAGQLSFAVSADLNELAKIPGLSAYVGASWGTGSDLGSSIHSAVPTSGLYAPSFYLGEMYLQEKLFRSKLTLLGGRLAASNGFAALPIFTNYVTYAINPNPISLGANDVTFLGPPPGSQWGAQATYAINPAIDVAAGVFNTNLNSANGENHGTEFALQEGNKGVLGIAEIDYVRNQESNSTGKPGQLTAGFLHSNNSFDQLNDPLERSDGYSGAYFMGQQMVFRPDGPGSSRGATLWGAWTINPKDLVSPVPWLLGGGVSYTGLIHARKQDVISAGLVHLQGSKYLLPANSNTEDVLEVNYQWNHSRYLTITPHGQYLFLHGSPERRNASVLGIQVALTL